jgi:hypothetical protein
MSNKELPCINCICLPICKSMISQLYPSLPLIYLVSRLTDKCSIFKTYIEKNYSVVTMIQGYTFIDSFTESHELITSIRLL